jgi:hypothetical protein
LTAFEPTSADGALPRAIGTHSFRLGRTTAERAIFPFNAWRWQRVHDYHRSLSGPARESADALLERVGGRTLFEKPLARRLARVDNRLRFASCDDVAHPR